MRFLSILFLPLFLHPICFLVAGLICGIFLQFFFCLHPAIHIATLFFALAALIISRKAHIPFLIFFASALFGLGIGSLRLQHQLNNQETAIWEICGMKIDCVCDISDIHISNDWLSQSKIKVIIKKYKECGTNDWIIVSVPALLYLKKTSIDLAHSDTLLLESVKFKSPAYKEPFYNYLLKEGLAATAFIKPSSLKIIEKNSSSIFNWILTQRKMLVDRLRNKFSHKAHALYSSLFLGNRSEEKQEQEIITQQSKTWGTSHHLARSGLHLVIFISLLTLLLRFLPITLFAKELALLFLCIIYHIFSWSSVSFLRAFLTFLLYKTCSLAQLPTHILHTLTLACGFILFFNPIQLFFLDFQLSFGLTFVLAWFNAAYLGKKYQ